MARYGVYPLADGRLVLDVQADILDELRTRVVVPLLPLDLAPLPAKRLNPVFVVAGKRYVMSTQFLGAVPLAALGAKVAELKSKHDEIVVALDMLFQGF